MQKFKNNQKVIYRTLLVLLAVCIVQVEWWLWDTLSVADNTYNTTVESLTEKADALNFLGQNNPDALKAIAQSLPDVAYRDGAIVPDQAVLIELETQLDSRRNRYFWESTFFLIVLVGAMWLLFRAVRDEVRLIKTKDTFLATVSHEFRTPLASLRLALETILLRNPSPEGQQALLNRMDTDLHRMEILVSNVLDASRLACGKLELSKEPVDLDGVVKEVVERATRNLPSGTSPIRITGQSGLQVLADPIALNTIIGNLLENALKAVSGVENPVVTLSAVEAKTRIEVTVSDNGKGFDPAAAETLFGKFHQGRNDVGSKESGTGLGLYIARKLLEMVDGEVTASSQGVGQGASFVVRLPKPKSGAKQTARAMALSSDGVADNRAYG